MISGRIDPGTFRDNGTLVPIQSPGWTIGSAPLARVAWVKFSSPKSQWVWSGTKWIAP